MVLFSAFLALSKGIKHKSWILIHVLDIPDARDFREVGRVFRLGVVRWVELAHFD